MTLVKKPKTRDYKDEYAKFQSSPKQIKKRIELNNINHQMGTYGNGDGLDVSHVNGGVKLEPESINRGREEKSRMKGSKRKLKEGGEVKSTDRQKTSNLYQGTPQQVADRMKKNPSFAKGMGEHYGVQLDKKSNTGLSKRKAKNGGDVTDIVKGLENVNKQRADMSAMNAPPTQLERYGKPEPKQEVVSAGIPDWMSNIAMGGVGKGIQGLKYLAKSAGKKKLTKDMAKTFAKKNISSAVPLQGIEEGKVSENKKQGGKIMSTRKMKNGGKMSEFEKEFSKATDKGLDEFEYAKPKKSTAKAKIRKAAENIKYKAQRIIPGGKTGREEAKKYTTERKEKYDSTGTGYSPKAYRKQMDGFNAGAKWESRPMNDMSQFNFDPILDTPKRKPPTVYKTHTPTKAQGGKIKKYAKGNFVDASGGETHTKDSTWNNIDRLQNELYAYKGPNQGISLERNKAIEDSTDYYVKANKNISKNANKNISKNSGFTMGKNQKGLTEEQLKNLTAKQRATYNKYKANIDKNIKKTEAGGFKKRDPNAKINKITAEMQKDSKVAPILDFLNPMNYGFGAITGLKDDKKPKPKKDIVKESKVTVDDLPITPAEKFRLKTKGKGVTFKEGLRDVHGKLIENPDGTKTDYYKETYTKKANKKEKLVPGGTSGETEKEYSSRLKKEKQEKLSAPVMKPLEIRKSKSKFKPEKITKKKVKPASKADRYVAKMTEKGKMGKVRKSLKTRLSEKVSSLKEGFKKKPLDARGKRKKELSDDKAAYDKKMREKYNLKYEDGGMLSGPSHKKGGIAANVGNQPIEMEGGEYVIKKSSAKKLGEDTLNYLNKTGKVPQFLAGGYTSKLYKDGGMLEAEALEMGGKLQDNRAGFTPVYEQGGKVTVSSEASAGDVAHTHTHSGYKAGE